MMKQQTASDLLPHRLLLEDGDSSVRPWQFETFSFAHESRFNPRRSTRCGLARFASNTLVSAGLRSALSLLKTRVRTHTVKEVLVSRECRFVWQ